MPVITDGQFRLLIPLIVAGIAILITFAGPTAAEALRYEREAILGGQIWRLVTGNLVHLSWSHLLLNLAGLGLVWALFGQALGTRAWAATFMVCALGVSLGVLLLDAGISWYVGLSGVLHGLFAAGAVADRNIKPGTRVLILGLFATKLLWEQVYGSLPGTTAAAGGNVIVEAHLYGALAGVAAGAIMGYLWKPALQGR